MGVGDVLQIPAGLVVEAVNSSLGGSSELGSASNELLNGAISEVGKLGLWMQAVGLLVVFWLAFQIVLIVQNYVKRKLLRSIELKIDNLGKKVDRLSKKIDK